MAANNNNSNNDTVMLVVTTVNLAGLYLILYKMQGQASVCSHIQHAPPVCLQLLGEEEKHCFKCTHQM